MSFERIADVYDVLANPKKRIEREGAFLSTWVGSANTVLDLACGTGIHAQFLAQKGFDVTACDLASAMIAYAQRVRPHPCLKYEVGDMRRPPTGPFDRAIILGNSINLLPQHADVARTLSATKDVLNPNGRLLLQVLNPAAGTNREPKQIIRSTNLDGQDVLVIKSMVPHGRRRFITLTYFTPETSGTEVSGPDGNVYQSDTESATLLDLGVDELDELLTEAGYEIAARHGGMDGAPLDVDQSTDLIIDAVPKATQ